MATKPTKPADAEVSVPDERNKGGMGGEYPEKDHVAAGGMGGEYPEGKGVRRGRSGPKVSPSCAPCWPSSPKTPAS